MNVATPRRAAPALRLMRRLHESVQRLRLLWLWLWLWPAREISPAQLEAALESELRPLLLDVRSPVEFAAGHLHAAMNFPLDELPELLRELPRCADCVLYCATGPRARRAGRVLRGAGFTAVRLLRGGIAAWRCCGGPIEPGEKPGAPP